MSVSYPSFSSAWTSLARSLISALYASEVSPLNGIAKLKASTKPSSANRNKVFISKSFPVDYWFMETQVALLYAMYDHIYRDILIQKKYSGYLSKINIMCEI